jgi:hypothetical protein
VREALLPYRGRLALFGGAGMCAHLDSSIRTGIVCRYQAAPGGPDSWHT